MSDNTASSLPKTPLDYVAEGYWQDFTAGGSIGGGMAYEAQLYDCELDESLASLQRADNLLTQIRRELIKANTWNEDTLLADEEHRNFMLFLGFYAGRVLAKQLKSKAHWFGQFELHKRYPQLAFNSDDFYQYMAAFYPISGLNHSEFANELFFVLEPIGLRLFGHIDRQFSSVQGGQVASGLYQAVSKRLSDASMETTDDAVAHVKPQPVVNNNSHSSNGHDNGDNTVVNKTSINKTSTNNVNNDAHKPNSVNNATVPEAKTADIGLSKIQSKADSAAERTAQQTAGLTSTTAPSAITTASSAISSHHAPEKPPKTSADKLSTTSLATKASVTPPMFTQLLTELEDIEMAQNSGNTEYQQASKVLDQFEQHIAKQSKPRQDVRFSERHLTARDQALRLLNQSADAGNTAAMTRLAMYDLLVEGLIEDKTASVEAGVDWVKQAASKNDPRAQRLLSKMYYQGVGVAQDIANGKYWLEQAAENGHTEAADLVAKWQQAEMLMKTKNQEQHSIKRYQLLIGGVVILAVLLLIFI